MPNRSRLRHSLENNSKKTLFGSLAAIIIIIALLAVFGVPALVEFAKLTGSREEDLPVEEEELIVVLPPYITTDFTATNSAEITLEGIAEDGDSVKLYREGKLVDEVDIDSDGNFIFTGIELKEGKNSFKLKAILNQKESRFSDPIVITYRKEAPELSIDYPSEGQSISNKDGNRLQIEGTTDPDVKVTINGSQAIVDPEGTFKHTIPISGGENTIKAIATDEAGNKTELERKFTYNP